MRKKYSDWRERADKRYVKVRHLDKGRTTDSSEINSFAAYAEHEFGYLPDWCNIKVNSASDIVSNVRSYFKAIDNIDQSVGINESFFKSILDELKIEYKHKYIVPIGKYGDLRELLQVDFFLPTLNLAIDINEAVDETNDVIAVNNSRDKSFLWINQPFVRFTQKQQRSAVNILNELVLHGFSRARKPEVLQKKIDKIYK